MIPCVLWVMEYADLVSIINVPFQNIPLSVFKKGTQVNVFLKTSKDNKSTLIRTYAFAPTTILIFLNTNYIDVYNCPWPHCVNSIRV